MPSTLNTEMLASAIKTKRGKKGLRDAAAEIGGISPATLSRVEQCNLPDVETFIKICNWLKIPTDSFITGKKSANTEISEKEKIVYQLRSSKELDADSVDALIAMVDIVYKKKLNRNVK
jgi:transcriptional regulator with XRE-family HTH domain